MALNCSHRPIFSAHISEDNLWSLLRVVDGYTAEGITERNGEGYARPWHVDRGEADERPFNFGCDGVDRCSSELNSNNLADLLPSDPFEMDIGAAFTAMLEDLEADNGSTGHENYGLVANRNNALKSSPFSGDNQFNQIGISCSSELQFGEKMESDSKSIGLPYEVLVSILSCLGVKDLLSVERVCKYLCCTVRSQPWLWRSIHIDKSRVNERIMDDALLRLACRAEGKLQCLSLVECSKVTDDCIRRILENNPQLTKLFVPGCTRLTIEGILNNVKIHNSNKCVPGIKYLRIGTRFGVTRQQFEEFKSLLGPGALNAENCKKPPLYYRGNCYLPFDDDRAIDIESCPRCGNFRLVYDCPAKSCQVKDDTGFQACRACRFCVPRCAKCGKCFSNNEYVETFCLDCLCLDCYAQLPNCENKPDQKVDDTCGAALDESSATIL